MNRRDFLDTLTKATLASMAVATASSCANLSRDKTSAALGNGSVAKAPLAITMWDFSWLERRWDGAGYADWDQILDGLLERGYNAVRIDAYPHLVAESPNKEWLLTPAWNTQVWGSPDVNRVKVMPALLEFISKCAKRGIRVALSCWYREDADKTYMKIDGPEKLAEIWIKTLHLIKAAGLMDSILYVDLCNEWPLDAWCPWFTAVPKGTDVWKSPASLVYLNKALSIVHKEFLDLPLCFSFFNDRVEDYLDQPMSEFDLFEHHIWMVQQNDTEFYKAFGYEYERFDPKGYTAMSLKAEALYRSKPDYWKKITLDKIARAAKVSRQARMPFITTECWAVVDYKDWPLLKWDWVKELNAECIKAASATGQWAAIATSNFCGPQFVGMWSDVKWHQRMTDIIKSGPLDPTIRQGRLWERL
jgi:hypothetical protein